MLGNVWNIISNRELNKCNVLPPEISNRLCARATSKYALSEQASARSTDRHGATTRPILVRPHSLRVEGWPAMCARASGARPEQAGPVGQATLPQLAQGQAAFAAAMKACSGQLRVLLHSCVASATARMAPTHF